MRVDQGAGATVVLASFAMIALGLSAPSLANASLGRGFDGVQADQSRMAARLASKTLSTHAVHTLSLPNGGTVQEYARPDGTVFAVSWRGPGRPDLRQLLGDDFQAVSEGSLRAAGRRPRVPIAVNRGDLIVHTGGHPGAYWGLAYLPQKIPSGFSADDLR